MRILENCPGIQAPTLPDYPNGRIESNNTIIGEQLNGDFVQALYKMVRDSGITLNDQPDNTSNGYQLLQAMVTFLSLSKTKTGTDAFPSATGSALSFVINANSSIKYNKPAVGGVAQITTECYFEGYIDGNVIDSFTLTAFDMSMFADGAKYPAVIQINDGALQTTIVSKNAGGTYFDVFVDGLLLGPTIKLWFNTSKLP